MIHWRKNIFLELTELESPSIDSDYKEGKEDNLLLQRNKTEDEHLVDKVVKVIDPSVTCNELE